MSCNHSILNFQFSIFLCALLFTLKIDAQRIVSLVPSVTYTLKQIGADDKVVGRTSYCPAREGSLVIGDVLNINIESIVALKPDVVFCMYFTKPQTIAQLKRLGIRVVTLNTPHNFDEICQQTLAMAQEARCTDAANKIIERERFIVDSITTKTRRSIGKMLFQVGSRPLFAVTKDYYLNEVITRVGCTNICADVAGGCSKEFVVRMKPDFIILTTMGGLATEEEMEWHKLIKNAHCLIVDENEAGCPTPTFYRKTLEKIANFVINK
ncbi:MAG: hypothetical protein E7069_06140 [Bacteroidales bacterium]|jgi:iron complex transport system substrate-binding protein|nr:hypothetical protein [Bacteroidales bacterium]